MSSVAAMMTITGLLGQRWDGIVTYMIIAGGGGGGWYHGGGGGAGGVLYGTATYTAPFTLTVGGGGTANNNGGNSAAFGLTAIGGGAGGDGQDSGSNGGSGGGRGGWSGNYSIGYGTAGQGYNGGNFSGALVSNGAGVGGGGGGAGGAGGNATYHAGQGGIGLTNAFLNTLRYGYLHTDGNYYVAGGGGGGGWESMGRLNGLGGVGGGGQGGFGGTTNYQSGTNNLGGGGGGKQQNANVPLGAGSGGSGAVLLRVPNFVTLSATGITLPAPVAIGDDHYYKFTTVGSGTVTMS